LIVGVFHPSLNGCGGAEWVAVNIINGLKSEGHQTVVLTNERIDNSKIVSMFGQKVNVDKGVIFPLEPFPVTDLHNVYTDGVRTLLLKSICDLVIDTHSNAILPGANITYIHFPLLGRLQFSLSRAKASYYLPYQYYEKRTAKKPGRLILANSAYTASNIRKITGASSSLLYPPISEAFYAGELGNGKREDLVVCVSRISPEKRLTLIPHIARLTSEKIHFLILGIKQSALELQRIFEQIETNDVSARVELMTDVPRDKLLNILKTSKVFLHLAIGEHFGVSIVEAMASGCIPIVHNSGGPQEFVPAHLRFDTLVEAAMKIEKAVIDWTPKQSILFRQAALPFTRESFLKRFLRMFKTYNQNLTHCQ
jgi:glycosyltransferase involved in cell wall biosynthesis